MRGAPRSGAAFFSSLLPFIDPGVLSMCILEIRPGEGGVDALAFATDLAETLTVGAARHHWSVDRRGAGVRGRTIVLVLTRVALPGAGRGGPTRFRKTWERIRP
jgi:hypothetical protein